VSANRVIAPDRTAALQATIDQLRADVAQLREDVDVLRADDEDTRGAQYKLSAWAMKIAKHLDLNIQAVLSTDFVCVKIAAGECGRSVSWIRQQAAKGEIRSERIGPHLLIDKTSLPARKA
jgi:hypothetical protein